ncbi:MAG: hypothetical protein M3O31_12325 [Acidobacteriota bacterium]|nr:hypothetical protein [Acidobacteriota bacterium]
MAYSMQRLALILAVTALPLAAYGAAPTESTSTALAISTPVGAEFTATQPAAETPHAWHFGTELDVLPYATRGYYGSFVVMHQGWRYRGVAARSTLPSFMVSDGFNNKRTDAYALLADRFFGPHREQSRGMWVGGGAEYWRNRIRRDGFDEYAHYDNVVLTIGNGYVWQLSRHFYLNPWSAAHFIVAGDRSIKVSGKTYKQSVFTPEASVKVGFTF